MGSWELRKLAAECRLQDQFIPNLEHRATIETNRVTRLNLNQVHLHNFSHFPVSIFKFTELRVLSLQYNGLNQLPTELGQLHNLEYLDLSFNFLATIPDEILSLPKLRVLRLNRNYIQSTSNFELLEQLEHLDLSSNLLPEFPHTLHHLHSLLRISVASNSLEILPEEIENLTHLQYLNLRANNLQELPVELGKLERLEKLNLYANPMYDEVLDPLIFRRKTKVFGDNKMELSHLENVELIQLSSRVLDYRFDPSYRVQFGVNSRGIPLYPILIYGEPSVGKRSLVESFIYDHLIPEDNLVIQQNRYMSWDYYIINSQQKYFQLWYPYMQDVVGPSYNTNVLNGFYYSNVIILVFDVSDKRSFRSVLHNIHRIVQIRHNPCPIIVVGNKSEHPFRAVNPEQIRDILDQISNKLKLEIDYIETSVVENVNVPEVFSTAFAKFQ